MKLYCATTNAEKLREFRIVLGDVQVAPGLAGIAPPEETGESFEKNAALKAAYYSQFCEGPLFAEDSGLEVDALGGEPGVRSARFAGEHATDEENNQLLLERMRGIPGRSARFIAVVALATNGKVDRIFTGRVEGRIAEAPLGGTGFGYDPLFFYPAFGCTFGEAGRERKSEVSHRAQALRAMAVYCKAKYS